MQNSLENLIEFTEMAFDDTETTLEADGPQPLTPPRQVELWSGRVAMVGFMTTVAAIAARATG